MSEVKVNKISPRTACGTVTLGDSGDTFTIPAGVSITNNGTASGFGATGAASWNTTVKTGDFTAVNGEGYFVDTTSGAVNVTLPAGAAGSVIAVKDYAGTFDTNNVTLVRNGSDKIGGQTINATLNTEGIAVTLVFIDSTQGWLVTDSGLQTEAPTAQFIVATGGTVTTSGNFKIHEFTGPGTFCVSSAGNAAGSNTVDYLVVAGGGGGGAAYAGGGGAGGYRFSNGTASGCYTAGPSPLGASALPVTATGFPITVGAGGAASTGAGSPGSMTAGGNGANSVFSTITSTGGGGGGAHAPSPSGQRDGKTGGSGGGGGNQDPGAGAGVGGTGNTPPVTPPQGNTGGNGYHDAATFANGGGGGGAGAVGGSIPTSAPTFTNPLDGSGGAGLTSCITASPVARGGGGGGGAHPSRTPGGAGGTGGGGAGGNSGAGTAGTVNTGGGAGGGGNNLPSSNGGAGGSGIVIIRYKFQ
jgi:hypothetical protein